jgi:hypothetical protein
MLFDFSILQLQYSFLDLCVNCFNYEMLWKGSAMGMSAWCPGGFLSLNGYLLLEIWEIFCYYFVDILRIPLS